MITAQVLTNDTVLYDSISSILKFKDCICHLSDENNILLDIYKSNAKLLVIDLDFCSELTFSTLEDIQELEYFPVIGILSNGFRNINKGKNFIKYIIYRDEIETSLLSIFDSFIDFKIRYDKIKECNEVIDVIDNEIDKLFKNQSYSIEELLQNTFINESFIYSKPSAFLVFELKENITYTDIYKLENNKIIKENERLELKGNFFRDNISIETEFYSNCDKDHYSDVDSYKGLFETVLSEKNVKIRNFSGYSTTDTAVIAINYNNYIFNTDAKIIKALCINLNLVSNVYKRVNLLNDAFVYTIEALARAGEAADDDTGSHIRRVNEFSKLAAELLGLDRSFVEQIHYSAQMHDVGKIHISHSILKKNGSLTEEEFNTMKLHTVYGVKIIGDSEQLKMAAEIALNHHEKFDGTGYPNGVSGYDIPLSARIVSLVDIYDALRNPRVYKPAFSHEKAVAIITEGDGRVKHEHFDPEILQMFKDNHQKFNEIWKTLQ